MTKFKDALHKPLYDGNIEVLDLKEDSKVEFTNASVITSSSFACILYSHNKIVAWDFGWKAEISGRNDKSFLCQIQLR